MFGAGALQYDARISKFLPKLVPKRCDSCIFVGDAEWDSLIDFVGACVALPKSNSGATIYHMCKLPCPVCLQVLHHCKGRIDIPLSYTFLFRDRLLAPIQSSAAAL